MLAADIACQHRMQLALLVAHTQRACSIDSFGHTAHLAMMRQADLHRLPKCDQPIAPGFE